MLYNVLLAAYLVLLLHYCSHNTIYFYQKLYLHRHTLIYLELPLFAINISIHIPIYKWQVYAHVSTIHIAIYYIYNLHTLNNYNT